MADPLEALLRPVASFLNRNIDEITPARELCRELDGKIVAIRIRDTALALYFRIDDQLITLHSDLDAEPDVAITGSLLTLAGMIGTGGTDSLRTGDVELVGDVRVAEAFHALLGYARPDFEEELSSFIGDAAAFRLGQLARGMRDWATDARKTMGGNISEYLQEEGRDGPSRYEVDRFTRAVNTLRDDVDRLEARIRRLEGTN